MAVTLDKNLILPKEFFKKNGMVILPLVEYEKIKEKVKDLKKERDAFLEEAETLKIIADGEQEYKAGKLKPIKSLAELR